MSDILTRLLLNTSDFDAKLGKAKQSTSSFSSSISSTLTSAVGKFTAAIGLTVGAAETFNSVIKSSQTLSDAFDNTLSACKGTVDAFFQSLATGNWDAFNGGLTQTIANMKEVAALRDALSDAKLSLGFDVRQFEREYVRLEGIIDDETKSKAERESAFASMQVLIRDFKGKVEATGAGAATTLVKELNARFGQNFNLEDVRKYISEFNNEFLNNESVARLKEYKEQLKELESRQYKSVTTSSMFGTSTVNVEDKNITRQIEAFKAQNSELEKMRLLNEDNDASRLRMVQEYEYVLEMQQKGDEFLKRSLEKQNKIAALNKGTTTAASTDKAKSSQINVPVVPQIHYDTPLGKKVLEWMDKGELPVLKQTIEIEEEMNGEENLFDNKNADKMTDSLQLMGDAFSNLGATAANFGNDMFAYMMSSMGNIAQMILQLQSLATAQGVTSASMLPFPANLAAIATVVATIASVFANIPKFATGGVVGGSSFFGDKLIARVNSGETILTNKQAGTALSMMNGATQVIVGGEARVSGKEMFITIRNYMRSSGQNW